MKTLRTYVVGFVLSILCTLVAFALVYQHVQTGHLFPSHLLVLPLLIGLAVVQLFIQLVCFLHLAEEQKPRWNLTALVFALLVVAILVGGTLWIMSHLNHRQPDLSEIYQGGVISPVTQDD